MASAPHLATLMAFECSSRRQGRHDKGPVDHFRWPNRVIESHQSAGIAYHYDAKCVIREWLTSDKTERRCTAEHALVHDERKVSVKWRNRCCAPSVYWQLRFTSPPPAVTNEIALHWTVQTDQEPHWCARRREVETRAG